MKIYTLDFFMIPAFIKEIKGLKIFDRCLLSQIHYLSAKKGYCFAGNAYFAQFFEVSEGTVKRSLKKLEDMGLISRVTSWNKRYIYLTCIPEEKEQEKTEEKVEEKKVEKNQNKGPVKYSREGFRFLQKLIEPPTKYHKAPKEERAGWTQEGLQAADECFERWKKKIGNSS